MSSTVRSATTVTAPTSVETASTSVFGQQNSFESVEKCVKSLFLFSGATRDAWADSANAAATTSPQKTWTEPVAKATPLTFAATTGTAYAAGVSARTGKTPRRDTAASSASATTSAAIAPATNCAAVSGGPAGAGAHVQKEG